jgi:hypothetical protein
VKAIKPTNKEGWEFAWVVYRPSSTGSGFLVQHPACLVIDTIYKKKDWGGLKITASSPGKKRVGKEATAAQTTAALKAFFN